MNITLKRDIVDRTLMIKKLQFVRVKCKCGHLNLIPVYEVFHVYEPIGCEIWGKIIASTQAQKP